MKMAYDPEKYREKREKVLGIKKRGLGIGAMAVIICVVILAGLSVVTVPWAVSYLSTRNLDDAIFKLESGSNWPENVITAIHEIDGIASVTEDKNHTRLVVTYDRRTAAFANMTAVFSKRNLNVTLLNQVNHRQHHHTLENEEETIETP